MDDGVRPRLFTKKEYYQLGDLGFFRGQRVELIEGRLIVHNPLSPLRASAIHSTMHLLIQAFGPEYIVRSQAPLDLGESNEPEPKAAVVPGPFTRYDQAHPTTALLIVEVSEYSITYDREKGGLYARAGIADYWIVNLVDRQVEVYRDPVADPTAPFGYRYATRHDVPITGTVSPLTLPTAAIPVAGLIP